MTEQQQQTYEVTAPDGVVLEVTGPAGASQDEVIRQAQALYKPKTQAPVNPQLEALKAAQAAKYKTAAEGGNPNLPWYSGYFNQDKQTPEQLRDRTWQQVASDQAANVIKGVPQAILGIPETVAALARIVASRATGNVAESNRQVGELVKGAIQPIATSVRGAGALVAPNQIQAPTDQEWSQAAQGAGANAASIALSEGLGAALKPIRRAMLNRNRMTMADAADTLAEQISGPTGATKLKAGEATQLALSTKIEDIKNAANQAYEAVDHAAQSNMEQVKTGSQTVADIENTDTPYATKQVPVYEQMAAPVSMKPVKGSLQPMFEELDNELTPSQKDISPTFNELKAVMNGPDHLPLTAADKMLSRFKKLGRDETLPGVKDRAAGIASAVIDPLSEAINTKAQQIGALDHLNIGRALTKEKYATAELLKSMSAEPVRLMDHLVANGDKSIVQLREVADTVPGELPNIGKSYVDGIIQKATAKGSFDAKVALNEWNKLGDESKRILYSETKDAVGRKVPGQLEPLNKFFEGTAELQSKSPGIYASGGMAAGALLGEHFGGGLGAAFGADLGLRVGRMAGKKIATLANGKLGILSAKGPTTLTSRQIANLLTTPSGGPLLQTALTMPATDPMASNVARLLLVTAAQSGEKK